MFRKGFTLIELLVVVAVLALLASIVFSNLSGAREGARISNALSFQSQTHSLLGSDLVGWWKLDGDLRDISGYDNNGTWAGPGSQSYVDGVPGTMSYSFNFPGGTTRPAIDLASAVILDGDFTVSYWFNTRRTNDWRIMNNVTTYNHAIWHRNPTRVEFSDPGRTIDLNQSFGLEEWDHLTVTRNSQNLVTVYRKGEVVGSASWTGELRINRIGGRTGDTGWNAFDGLGADIRVYKRALTASEVQTLYAQTKDKYLANE